MPRAREPGERGIVWASFLTLLLATSAAGLDPDTALTQYGHTAWRIRDGYFAGQPGSMAQTTDGFLWIGTGAGLIRFDGVRFVPWKPPAGSPLPDDRIINILGASDGSLWIGTANGLARWHGGRLTVHARAGRFGALIEDRQGTVWAGHTRALTEVPPLCRFRRGEFQCFEFPEEPRLEYVGALHEDRKGNLWIGGPAGVCRWRPREPVTVPVSLLLFGILIAFGRAAFDIDWTSRMVRTERPAMIAGTPSGSHQATIGQPGPQPPGRLDGDTEGGHAEGSGSAAARR